MFDPFGDFEARGYLRNTEGLKDLQTVKVLENVFFQAHIELALAFLDGVRGPIRYAHFKRVHETLFRGIYPWAGKDRAELGVAPLVSKGMAVQFVQSNEIERAMDWALAMGNDTKKMAASPGAVMGAFAWAHPFLDGNGRAMLLLHAQMCKRAGIRIDWQATRKDDYLNALTAELVDPKRNALDEYLSPFIKAASKSADLLDELKELPGLDGLGSESQSFPDIAYGTDDQVAVDSYLEIKRRRGEAP